MLLILSKLLVVAAAVGLLHCSPKFQSMSRELDEQALSAIRRMMHASEESGYPPDVIPLLMLLTALSFMLAIYFTTAGGR